MRRELLCVLLLCGSVVVYCAVGCYERVDGGCECLGMIGDVDGEKNSSGSEFSSSDEDDSDVVCENTTSWLVAIRDGEKQDMFESFLEKSDLEHVRIGVRASIEGGVWKLKMGDAEGFEAVTYENFDSSVNIGEAGGDRELCGVAVRSKSWRWLLEECSIERKDVLDCSELCETGVEGSVIAVDTTDGAIVRGLIAFLRLIMESGLDAESVDSVLHGI